MQVPDPSQQHCIMVSPYYRSVALLLSCWSTINALVLRVVSWKCQECGCSCATGAGGGRGESHARNRDCGRDWHGG